MNACAGISFVATIAIATATATAIATNNNNNDNGARQSTASIFHKFMLINYIYEYLLNEMPRSPTVSLLHANVFVRSDRPYVCARLCVCVCVSDRALCRAYSVHVS